MHGGDVGRRAHAGDARDARAARCGQRREDRRHGVGGSADRDVEGGGGVCRDPVGHGVRMAGKCLAEPSRGGIVLCLTSGSGMEATARGVSHVGPRLDLHRCLEDLERR